MRGFVRPYAEALLGAADSIDEATRVRDELAAFADAMGRVPGLEEMARNPSLPVEAKLDVLDSLAERMELAPLSRRFLRALITRYRLHRLGEVVDGITEALDEASGVAVAEVRTADELEEEQRERLREILEEKLSRSVRLDVRVDPDLLAGFVVQVGSTLWDASLDGQLERLTARLSEAS